MSAYRNEYAKIVRAFDAAIEGIEHDIDVSGTDLMAFCLDCDWREPATTQAEAIRLASFHGEGPLNGSGTSPDHQAPDPRDSEGRRRQSFLSALVGAVRAIAAISEDRPHAALTSPGWDVHCETCGWSATASTEREALSLQSDHFDSELEADLKRTGLLDTRTFQIIDHPKGGDLYAVELNGTAIIRAAGPLLGDFPQSCDDLEDDIAENLEDFLDEKEADEAFTTADQLEVELRMATPDR
ncbi:MAG: hypothetical protein OXS47_05725 [Chloroflexota bacterium]|nr:hypothetical protein [Chloroflexota bacterium]